MPGALLHGEAGRSRMGDKTRKCCSVEPGTRKPLHPSDLSGRMGFGSYIDNRPKGTAEVSEDAHEVPLADFIGALRDQIREAQRDTDPGLPIEVGRVTVEFAVLTRKEGEGKAGVRFWVVEAGVSGKGTAESTQKVSMELYPLSPTGERARIRDIEPPPPRGVGR